MNCATPGIYAPPHSQRHSPFISVAKHLALCRGVTGQSDIVMLSNNKKNYCSVDINIFAVSFL